MKLKQTMLMTAIALLSFLILPSISIAGKAEILNVNDYKCKEIMLLTGDHREIAIGFLHGYLLGKKGTPKFSSEAMATATDNFLTECINNPNNNAVKVLSKQIK